MSTCGSPRDRGVAWRFNPFEVSICGLSNSGKTTLVENLVAEFANRRVGCVKHAAHGFQADRPGSDSARHRAAGAYVGQVIGPDAMAQFGAVPERFDASPDLLATDMVLVEGYKHAQFAKVVTGEGNYENVIGVGTDAADIANVIEAHFQAQVPPLYGLVLGGGRSERMGQDKATLDYHGKPQLQHAFELLSSACEEVYVSCRPGQTFGDLPTMPDQILNAGPLGGILTALRNSQVAWLVLACDLPFVTKATIAELAAGRDPFRFATAFVSRHDGFPEPVCAIYEPKALHRLLHFFGLGYNCPRKALINSRIALRTPRIPEALDNINTPKELAAARAILSSDAF